MANRAAQIRAENAGKAATRRGRSFIEFDAGGGKRRFVATIEPLHTKGGAEIDTEWTATASPWSYACASADYLVEGDTLARVTLVDTTTSNSDMRGTDNAALATAVAALNDLSSAEAQAAATAALNAYDPPTKAELDAADDAVLAAIAALNNIDAVAAQAAAAAALAAYNVAKVGDAMGAVASVTGNVGGNVVGSVGSVTNPVTAGTVSDKTGYALAATGLDAIPITAPAGVASTFREIVVQGWRRMFKKATMTATQMVTYADDGTTPLTTQAVSDDGETQTQGAAS